jgi:hypothetical protein
MAGIKKFGGDEIMDMFIDSEIEVMVDESGIEKDVFFKIKEEFMKTNRDVSEIKDVAEKLNGESLKKVKVKFASNENSGTIFELLGEATLDSSSPSKKTKKVNKQR